ncbi:MAG: NADPH-dependent F420 reductase [Dehalococcoidia bacterium]|nr:NADPH-dependent F420 reductase [Dehalococcoidia bacterium]|tara:strand:- start:1911 stop:2555 length:645 start_codon:yes stop_codon:yes gene_type:complete
MADIAIIGGTGPEGRGLALRWAMAGHHLILGSRDEVRARDAANSLKLIKPGIHVSGHTNRAAIEKSDCIVFSIPYEGLDQAVSDFEDCLSGKLVISVIAPMDFRSGYPKALTVAEGSAAELIQARVPDCIVTSGFQNLSAQDLLKPDTEINGDIIICGDDLESKKFTMELADCIAGLRGVDGGYLGNSKTVEGLTALILYINKQTKSRSTIKLL